MVEFLTQLENGLGLDVVLWFQAWRTPFIGSVFEGITFTGTSVFFVLVMPIIYWCYNTAVGRRVITLFLLSVWLTQWFKEWWQRPRPPAISTEVHALGDEPDYGIPSGHTLGTTALWGAFAWHLRRQWLTGLVIVYVSLVALSRLVLGVHFPHDVVAGLLIGVGIVLAYAQVEPGLSAWFARKGPWAKIAWIVGLGVILLLIHPVLFPDRSGYGLRRAVVPISVFVGAGLGFVLEAHTLRFDAGGVWWKRVLRYLLGTLVLLILFFGLSSAFENLTPIYVFTFVQYSLIGFWVGYGGPWLFVRLRLVEWDATN